ncbi:MAG: amidase [Paracoccaceae bacterium]|nr:amidase [Paracoccaceae bacterium]
MTASAAERLETALAAIQVRNPELSIVTSLDAPTARLRAEESDARRAAGAPLSPLDGLILGIKDNIAVRGQPWTGGLGARRDTIAENDATVVSRLRRAGAIPLAMLNMHEGALGATTDNPHFGRARNPLDPDRTPGGSSGGSGAALAAGFCDATLGSDTMGSVRIPAAYCGTFGIKPTRGLIPRTGLLFLSPTLDTIGPLAKDVDTLAAVLEVMASVDPGDPTSRAAPPDWQAGFGNALPRDLTVGIPKQLENVGCEPAVVEGLGRAKAELERADVTVSEVDLTGWDPNAARIAGLLVSEAEGATALADILDRPGDRLMSDELRRLLTYGRNLPRERLAQAYEGIGKASDAVTCGFAEVDVILMPTAPQRPFRHDDPTPTHQADLTALANFSGAPALAVPVPMEDLPASVQVMGPAFSEPLLLQVGRLLHERLAS